MSEESPPGFSRRLDSFATVDYATCFGQTGRELSSALLGQESRADLRRLAGYRNQRCFRSCATSGGSVFATALRWKWLATVFDRREGQREDGSDSDFSRASELCESVSRVWDSVVRFVSDRNALMSTAGVTLTNRRTLIQAVIWSPLTSECFGKRH